jgi:hypothetical protein
MEASRIIKQPIIYTTQVWYGQILREAGLWTGSLRYELSFKGISVGYSLQS